VVVAGSQVAVALLPAYPGFLGSQASERRGQVLRNSGHCCSPSSRYAVFIFCFTQWLQKQKVLALQSSTAFPTLAFILVVGKFEFAVPLRGVQLALR